MKIMTKAFGEIEILEKQKIFFKEGIFGFEDIHDYVLLDAAQEKSPFYWLQSEKIPEIAFVVINPTAIEPDYKCNIDPKDLKELEINVIDETLIFSIVTIHENPKDITVNLLGPIVINKKTHTAKQIINQNEKYTVKHPIVKKGAEKC
jgi:flagellar assembly factor FliW